MGIDNTILSVNALTVSDYGLVRIEAKIRSGAKREQPYNLFFADGSVQRITIVDNEIHIVAE